MSAVLGKLAYELEVTGNGADEIEAWNKKIRDSVPNIQRFDKKLSESEREMLEFAKKTKTGSQEVDKLNQKKLGKLKNEFGSLQKIAGAAGTGVLGNTFKNFMGQAASAANEYEQTVVSFKTMLGSANEAKKVLKDLENFSLKTPFTPEEVNKSGRSLIAFGVAQDKLIPALNSIGDVASGLNIPFNELSDIYGKIKVQQTVYAEDLNQLGGRGIPIFTELAKVMGVNSKEIKKLASQGKISFSEIEKAFESMSGEGGQFFSMMKEQSMTAAGMISTIQGYFGVMQRSVGQAFMKMIKPLMEKVMPIMQKFVNWIASPQGLAILQILLPIIATLIGVMMVGSVYSLASAFGVLNVLMSPITLIILGIVTALTAIYVVIDDLITYLDGGQSALSGFWDEIFKIEIVQKIIAGVKSIYNWFKKLDFSKIWNSDIVTKIVNILKRVFSLFKRYLSFIFKVYSYIFVDLIFPIIEALVPVFIWVFKKIWRIIEVVASFLMSTFEAVLTFVEGFANVVGGVLGWVADIFGGSDSKKIEIETSQKNAKLEKRALGGPVHAGRAYLVGEEGGGRGEIFVPSQSGNILNHSTTKKIINGGARVTIAPVINISGNDSNMRQKIKNVVNDMLVDARHQLGLGMT